MSETNEQTIAIRTDPNPWFYGPLLFLAVCAIYFQPNTLGFSSALLILAGLAAWWLTRTQCVLIAVDTRQAEFVNSTLNPFRKHRLVSLAGYSRVYADTFYRHGGWSIHLSGPRGEHLLLARIPSPGSPSFHDEHVRSICARIASGLHIADGGGG